MKLLNTILVSAIDGNSLGKKFESIPLPKFDKWIHINFDRFHITLIFQFYDEMTSFRAGVINVMRINQQSNSGRNSFDNQQDGKKMFFIELKSVPF